MAESVADLIYYPRTVVIKRKRRNNKIDISMTNQKSGPWAAFLLLCYPIKALKLKTPAINPPNKTKYITNLAVKLSGAMKVLNSSRSSLNMVLPHKKNSLEGKA